ncbi:hypothetical protein [Salinibacterium sp. SWN248]|uniref:hypothetical protein n=1 Tax=Salinibacterium sp. SWN248 TaxID=2792056 RepID=UPI0018CDF314|nr:hypothetical protein [Salinibacterium sp. SWN248]MBH0024425.1 hypothetical protein [Salinibacterium sp. SWN248]
MTNNQLVVAPTLEYRTLMLDLFSAEDAEAITLSADNFALHLLENGLDDTWLDPWSNIDSSAGYAIRLKFRGGEELMILVAHGWEVTSYLIENGWHFVHKTGNNWHLTEAPSEETITA